MARVKLTIKVQGLTGQKNDFGQLAGRAAYEHGKERWDGATRSFFDETQERVPVGEGDKRRPAGALRDSGQWDTSHEDDRYTAEVRYGENGPDPRVNYAQWARFKHYHKTGVDFIADAEDASYDTFHDAVNAPWDYVFSPEDYR